MKLQRSAKWIPSLLLAVAWLPGSLAQDENKRPAPPATATQTPGALTTTPDLASPPVISVTNDLSAKTKQTAKIKLSPWAKEIVKLAEARIGEEVMYSFIDNSGTFNLGAEQIIYLADVGVPSAVIAAMLQHDQDLVSGVRPLTIASEPEYEPILPSRGVMTTASPTPAVVATPAASVTPSSVASGIAPEVSQSAANVQMAAARPTASAELSAAKTTTTSLRPAPASKKSLYPTREGHAVELTAPIVFLGEVERTPNTFIIVGFPRPEPAAP